MKKTVLITGASSGIGNAAARRFARNGWNVVATMRSPDAEKDLVCLDDMLVTRLDVQDHDSICKAIEAGIARFGKIDALINNAGFKNSGAVRCQRPWRHGCHARYAAAFSEEQGRTHH
jgi:NAD(P)-dependent dehydrogenase (short-subunit alcohol dehydrogenase family)